MVCACNDSFITNTESRHEQYKARAMYTYTKKGKIGRFSNENTAMKSNFFYRQKLRQRRNDQSEWNFAHSFGQRCNFSTIFFNRKKKLETISAFMFQQVIPRKNACYGWNSMLVNSSHRALNSNREKCLAQLVEIDFCVLPFVGLLLWWTSYRAHWLMSDKCHEKKCRFK